MNDIFKAKMLIDKADSIIILSGAGMGADSGLPVFRSNDGLWEHYPFLKELNLNFKTIADPESFIKYPEAASKFYQHRMDLYNNTEPHEGFNKLLSFVSNKVNSNYFIVTSNVDQQFQKAGFDPKKIYEVHGNINHWQCSGYSCSRKNKNLLFLDFEQKNGISYCKHCNSVARPNILMFQDYYWEDSIYNLQRKSYLSFLFNESLYNTVIIEIGAGQAIKTIRTLSLEAANTKFTKPIRINIDPSSDPRYLNIVDSGLNGILALF